MSELKKELGLDPNTNVSSADVLNIRSAIYEAVEKHAAHPRSPGFIKAYGLDDGKEWD